ncbi:MAG TPA: tautomerase family protein [Methylomirabilota bacterium]|nr:tautomerase family protein [Methylomirabilota bacterium]
MPVITVQMLEGRTIDQKREIAAAITDVMVKIGKAHPDSTMVIMQEVPKSNWSRAGKLVVDS